MIAPSIYLRNLLYTESETLRYSNEPVSLIVRVAQGRQLASLGWGVEVSGDALARLKAVSP